MNNVLILCTGEGVREQNKSLKGHRWCFVFIIKKFSFKVYKKPYFSAFYNKTYSLITFFLVSFKLPRKLFS